MIRRYRVRWPDPRPFRARPGRPIRLLAASDEQDAALDVSANREALGPIDLVVGCGDLEPSWLAFLADAFSAPLVYIRGNHDRGLGWAEESSDTPLPLRSGEVVDVLGLPVAAMEWPGVDGRGNRRHPEAAWGQVLRVAGRRAVAAVRGRGAPLLVISHAAPAGAGDGPDPYHAGFPAYRWLLDWMKPPLWLHGHTTLATVADVRAVQGPTTLINVTGAALIELDPPSVEPPAEGPARR